MPEDTHNYSGKVVSIICRTVGRPELTECLRSIAAQHHKELELVLVNALGKDLRCFDSELPDCTVRHVGANVHLGRPQAANVGLDAANGEFILILDEDDWIAPNHIQALLQCLVEHPDCRAAYSNVRKANRSGEALDYTFAEDYNPVLLMRDNYIPMHAVLFSRDLIEQGCRFDEALEVYEDWDFWLQLSRHTNFFHLDVISAFYREGGESATQTDNPLEKYEEASHLGQARLLLFDKWLPQWSGREFNRLLEKFSEEYRACAADSRRTAERLQEELKNTERLDRIIDTNREEFKSALQDREEQIRLKDNYATELEGSIAALRESKSELNRQLVDLNNQLAAIEFELELLHNSLSWKITSPLRTVRSLLRKPELAPAQQPPEQTAARGPQETARVIEQAKHQHEEAARAALRAFLDSEERLKFPRPVNARLNILLVFYNQAHLSLLCLRSLLEKADADFELIIVDNASADDSDALLARIDNAQIIRNAENLGFVLAVNQAAERAQNELLLLLNNDALIDSKTLSRAMKVLDEVDNAGAVGARITLLDGSLQEAGSIIWRDGSCLGYGRGQPPANPEFMFRREVDYCSGAFLLFRNRDFQSLGGFDEAFKPAYYEESDFCLRLREQGKKVIYDPFVTITHYEFASSGGLAGATKLQQEHRKILLDKHQNLLQQQFETDEKIVIEARTANRHANLLLIDDRVPHPWLGSGYPRSAQLVNSLCALPINVGFYPLQTPSDDWEQVYKSLDPRVEVLLDKGRGGLRQLLHARRGYYDRIVVSRVHNMLFLNELIEREPDLLATTVLIYDAEAIFANREILKLELQGIQVSGRERRRLIESELNQARHADAVIAVSEHEAGFFRKAGHESVIVLGHTLELKPGEQTFKERRDFLFVGALRDEGSPNVDSLLWFVSNIMPLIQERLPGTRLLVAGDCGAPSLRNLDKNLVSFLGRQDSLTDLYNRCRVFIAPTRFAAGIPHKVHEAVAHGLPSVTTSLLAQQLGWQDRRQLLAGDSADKFSARCIELYSDEALWTAVRTEGLQRVAEDCSDARFRSSLQEHFLSTF